MIGKLELFIIAGCLIAMGVAIYFAQVDEMLTMEQTASVGTAAGLVVVGSELDAQQQSTNIKRTMQIDDITIGTGAEATTRDTVAVHYVGRLEDGTEFDNSHKRGAPIEFTLGAGQVIQGWEEGITGMQVGGERVLVIPPEKAYGDRGIGPIPGGATLTFTVELVEIK